MRAPISHEPRAQLDTIKSAKSARNKASTKFEFSVPDAGRSDQKIVMQTASQETPNFPKNYESFQSVGFGMEAVASLPVELTEDAYHIRPGPHAF